MALAIFDLDNTLIEGDSDHAWGEFLVENNIVNKEEYKKANDKFLQDYQSGQLDIFEYLEFALKPLAENTPEDLMKLRKDFFEQKIKPILLPKGFELLKTHREKGDFLLIITATNRFVTELIAEAFEVDDLIATEPERTQSGFTGKVEGTPSFKEGKITRLNAWLERQTHSLDGAYFYSDSHNDLPLLKLVQHPIAVDPDETLRQFASDKQWPIISLRN